MTVLKGMDKFQQEIKGGFKDSFIFYSETMGLRAGIVERPEDVIGEVDGVIISTDIGGFVEITALQILYNRPYQERLNFESHPNVPWPMPRG